ncbi:MAG TPA: hypothetical protein EYN73_04875 [Chromatiaceae bacterium]|nr:hypothetical protein [Chromatiaceae bacterium]
MAFLLSKPTSKSNTQAIIELVETVAKGRQAIPLRLRRQFRGIQFNPVIHHPEPSAIGAHPLCRVPPADPILNLARRLQIPACLKGKTVFVSFPVLARCLDGANSAIRDNLQQAILLLQRSGYHLHNSHTV